MDEIRDEAGEVIVSDLAADLEGWWEQIARDEVMAVVPKAVEYSSTDLLDIGTSMARAMGREVTHAEAVELGISFYALGKMSRIMGAIQEGRQPSDDSWHDLGVYARMVQRVRQSGGWPTGGNAQ
jgi:hypothetical protein